MVTDAGAPGLADGVYCLSADDCDSTALIIGLHSTWDSTLKRVKSPKVGLFKSFVENALP